MTHYEISPSLRSQGLHAHDYYEFFLHINGGRQYCVDDTVFDLKPFQLIIIPPLHMHGLVCDRDLVDYERCYLYLTPETLKNCCLNKIDFSSLIENACANKKITTILSDEAGKEIIRIMQNIERKSKTPKNINLQLLEDYSNILTVLRISLQITMETSKTLFLNSSNSGMYKILHYINQHFTENLTIKELSCKFNMSESALSHDFRKYSNKSVYEYVLYKRIIKAKELLVSEMSLTQIAMECGFNDYSNFLRVFKKFSLCSPKEYKNRLLKNTL